MAAASAERLAGRIPVVIPLSLAATRLGLYDTADDHPSERDVTLRLEELRRRGVFCEHPGQWRSDLGGTGAPLVASGHQIVAVALASRGPSIQTSTVDPRWRGL
jgi:hypothetical protein